MTPPRSRALRPLAVLGVLWLTALACTRATPGYCGDDGGACPSGRVCSKRTLVCEMPPDGGNSDRPDTGGGDAVDARDAGDASPEVSKGCKSKDDCTTSDAGPACVLDGGLCVLCILDDDCKAATPACTTDHRCIECVGNSHCKDPKPVCLGELCVECVAPTDCKPPKAVCENNACYECLQNTDCKDPTRPICEAYQCRACMADSECKGDPGVCMRHADGRCATPSETIVVEFNASCVETATGANASIGTAAIPVCSMQPLAQLVTANRRVIVVRGTVQAASGALPTTTGGGEVSIVGQQSAVIAGGASPGLQISGAEVYVRSVAFKSSTLAGIRATSSVLRLDGVVVDNNTGGGIFLQATQFSIMNSTITNNGPGQEGAITWGGLLVNSVPPTGQKLLQRVTVQNNKAPGISCIASIEGTGVHASGNMALDIQAGCGFTSCGSASATCGAP